MRSKEDKKIMNLIKSLEHPIPGSVKKRALQTLESLPVSTKKKRPGRFIMLPVSIAAGIILMVMVFKSDMFKSKPEFTSPAVNQISYKVEYETEQYKLIWFKNKETKTSQGG